MHAVASIDSLVQGWVGTYGLLAILLLMTVQCVGVPFPSEVIMPVAGYLASTGSLNLVVVVVVGIVGNVVGSLIAYGLAAWLGEPVLLGPGRYIGIRPTMSRWPTDGFAGTGPAPSSGADSSRDQDLHLVSRRAGPGSGSPPSPR